MPLLRQQGCGSQGHLAVSADDQVVRHGSGPSVRFSASVATVALHPEGAPARSAGGAIAPPVNPGLSLAPWLRWLTCR
ncbi:hypothetical protein ACFFX0_16335 [Citricoccus parietis]|uniref:Uncharacterized protein n=1 Tax=Citricoccus parietis TaxID=592307 RepID=A0ABV5G176_9MICC